MTDCGEDLLTLGDVMRSLPDDLRDLPGYVVRRAIIRAGILPPRSGRRCAWGRSQLDAIVGAVRKVREHPRSRAADWNWGAGCPQDAYLLGKIRAAGAAGITLSRLILATPKIADPAFRHTILTGLANAGEIDARPHKPARGPAGTMYVAREFIAPVAAVA